MNLAKTVLRALRSVGTERHLSGYDQEVAKLLDDDRLTGTDYAFWDTWLYTLLCLVIGLGF